MALTRKDIPSDEEVLTGAIDRALKRMKDEDKGELAFCGRASAGRSPCFSARCSWPHS